MDNRRISSLDGLRGFAALIVFVSHYSNETDLFGGLLGWGAGQLGVMLFFALAGFLMAYLYLDEPASPQLVRQYAIRRFARIYPLFLIVAALPMLLLAIGYPEKVAMGNVNSVERYLRQIFFIDRGENVFWTIQVEVFFYVCFVAIWMCLSRGVSRRWVFSALLALGIFLPATTYGDTYQWIKHAHLFIFGVLLRVGMKYVTLDLPARLISLVGFSSLAMVILSFPKIFLAISGIETDPWNSFFPLIAVLVLMFCVIKDEGLLGKLFSCRPARFLGKISYSMYLLHYFVLMAVVSYTVPSHHFFLNFTGTLIAVLLLSWACNRWVEAPLQQWVMHVSRRVAARSSVSSTPL